MLTSLTLKQFILIDQLQLELDAGMTVFTGETGAGKSMLMGALAALFGARTQSDWVRHGAERAELTAIWEGEDARIEQLLAEADIEADDALIIRRTITREGRSRCALNGVPVPAKTLKSLGEICLDLHGQHAHQSLMQPAVQQQLLDQHLPAELLETTQRCYRDWQAARQQLQQFQTAQQETAQQAAWMRDELARLAELEIAPGVVEALQQEIDVARHHAQIQQAASQAMMLLDEAEPSVRELLAHAGHVIANAEQFHNRLQQVRAQLDQMDLLLGEITPELRDLLDQSFDSEALERAEHRLLEIHAAMRRHDCDEAGLIAKIDDWQQKLTALDSGQWDRASLEAAVTTCAAAYQRAAGALHQARQHAAETLCSELRPFLDQLALGGMQVGFVIEPHETADHQWRADGWDQVRMQIISNPGEPWRDLAAVASGGELSRLVLALKGCGALADAPKLAVFDEVDTGIGGETAWCIGEMLSAMGRERQVLVISHLPQVAVCADQQMVIRKSEQDGRTVTALSRVTGEARQAEVARMLGGNDPQSLAHATEMLIRGQTIADA